MSRQTIIDLAKKDIGYKEESFRPDEKVVPEGTNRTKFGVEYGLNGQPWCAIWVSCKYSDAGHPLGHVDSDKGYHYVPSALNFWRKNGKITVNPQPADIVIFDWQRGKTGATAHDLLPDHTGIFLSWIDKKAGTFLTIEANTSIGNDSNGGQVMIRQRNMAFVVAFVNPLNLPA